MTPIASPRRRIPLALVLTTGAAAVLTACGGSTDPDGASTSTQTSATTTQAPIGTSAADPTLRMITVGDHQLAFHVTPGDGPTIVLDAGSGLDSTLWSALVPQLSAATGAQVISYDRAGVGDSDEVPGPWSREAAAADLAAGLHQLGVTDDVILVPHSQAAEVATQLVLDEPGLVAGAVFVDASLPEFFTDAGISTLEALNAPAAEQLASQPSTKETRTYLSMLEGYRARQEAYHELAWPDDVPVTVIVSEQTPFVGDPAGVQQWLDAATAFAAAGPDREIVTAAGSSHIIPADRPDVILDEVAQMAQRT